MELQTQMVGSLRYLNPANIASYSDVKLISLEGECFYTNRLVLSSASLMFHTIFQEVDLITSVADEDFILVLTEYSSAHLRNVVDFITRGIVFLSSDTNSAVDKGGVITNGQVLNDFFDFGIDLSTLLMLPVEDSYLEKFFNFDQESIISDVLYPVDLNDIKLEQMDHVAVMYQPVQELSEDEQPLKRRAGRPRGSTKEKRAESQKSEKKLKVKKQKLKDKKTLKIKIKSKTVSLPDGDAAPEDRLAVEEDESKYSDSEATLDEEDEWKPVKCVKTGSVKKKKKKTKEQVITKSDVKKLNQCPHCDASYNDLQAFKQHVLGHGVDGGAEHKLHFCLQCGKDTYFKNRHELHQHKVDFHIGKTYTCDRCGQVFKGNYYHRFLRHLEEHDLPRKLFACVSCGFLSKSKSFLSIHRKIRGPYHTPQCVQCPVEFKTWSEHEKHVNEMHKGRMLVKCGLCEEIFETPQRLRIHRRDVHFKAERKISGRKAKDVVCQFCGILVNLQYYDIHLENKHATGKHQCPDCGKIVNHPSVLQRHITNMHNPFPCEKCGKTIKNPVRYRMHLLSVHTPEHLKPHQCTICDPHRGFHTLKNLRDHQNVHSNSKPYKCETCGVGFNSEANKFAHVKAIHKGIKRRSKHERAQDQK